MTQLRSHQTVRLEAGSHAWPAAGACVVELVNARRRAIQCLPVLRLRVVAAFLRTYNDLIDDTRRQDLYLYAAAIVDSKSTKGEVRRRARLCRRWMARIAAPAFLHRPFWTTLSLNRERRNSAAASYAAMVAVQAEVPGERHRAALALVDELLAVRTAMPTLAIPTSDGRAAGSHVRLTQRPDRSS